MARAANTYRANQNLTHDQKVNVRAQKQRDRKDLPYYLMGKLPLNQGQRVSPVDAVTKAKARTQRRTLARRWNGIGDKGAKFAVSLAA